jgi:hypothetical protein
MHGVANNVGNKFDGGNLSRQLVAIFNDRRELESA